MHEEAGVTSKTVCIEDHTVIPFDIVHLEFKDVNALLDFLHDDEPTCLVYSISKFNNEWKIHVRGDDGFNKECHENGGVCGLCGGELDPSVPVKKRSDLHVKNAVVCGYCGRMLRNEKSPTIVDMFLEITGNAPGNGME